MHTSSHTPGLSLFEVIETQWHHCLEQQERIIFESRELLEFSKAVGKDSLLENADFNLRRQKNILDSMQKR